MRTPLRSTSFSIRSPLTEAVILMAGFGSRLRGSSDAFLKPLVPVCGRPLVSYTISALAEAGIKKINAVVGFESARLSAAVRRLVPLEINVRFIENPDWQKKNGISLLAAARAVTPPFLLTMSDHLFDRAIIDLLTKSADFSQLNLAVDKKLNTIFDLDDAMKVQTRGDRVIAIGKNLPNYDAIDTGLFVCPADIFKYLEKAKQAGNCSLNDGVRLMAADNRVRALDIGDAWWQDVDTPDMLRHAEERMRIVG
jgi:1L-myo-inositol 1-phosphate cytidylyltransferase